MVVAVSRAQVLGFRVRAQQLAREPGAGARLAETAVLDIGVQDTGTDGGAWALPGDVPRLTADPPRVTRLLAPYDLFLQARDRSLLVPDAPRAKELWPVLGRPGAVLVDGGVVGTWRPRAGGGSLRVKARAWAPWPPAVREAVAAQAERLAAHRGVRLAGVEIAD